MSKKILIVSDFYEPHKSGIVTYVNQLIKSLKEKGYLITVLTTKHDNGLERIDYINNIKIIRCKPTIAISRGFYSLDLVITFFKIYKNFNYINLHLPLTEIFPIAFFLNKKQTIINYHCLPVFSFPFNFIKFYFYIFGIISVIKSKNNIVLSKDYFNNFLFHYKLNNNIVEVPPYVILNKTFKKLNDKSKIIKIGYLGRLSSEKGIQFLILLSNYLIKENTNHKLIIAGDTQDHRFKQNINKIKDLGKNNKNINFVGKLNNLEKIKFYNQIDLFILPSINSFEAFGIVQLEAMSYGVPVIASNICGVRTVVKNTNNGFLFENKNLKDLIKAFHLFKKNRINSKQIIENLYKNYNKELFDNKISKLF